MAVSYHCDVWFELFEIELRVSIVNDGILRLVCFTSLITKSTHCIYLLKAAPFINKKRCITEFFLRVGVVLIQSRVLFSIFFVGFLFT